MPHQCVKCGTIFKDGSNDLLKGCENCGSKFFFYVKKESLQKAKEITSKLTIEDKKQIESDVLEIMGDKYEDDQPVVLDLESIRILGPGKYELDLVDLFKGKPLVYKLDEGKYLIDIASTFSSEELDEKDLEPK
ncbi:MAG: Zn-ribbon containing protein [archaeon]